MMVVMMINNYYHHHHHRYLLLPLNILCRAEERGKRKEEKGIGGGKRKEKRRIGGGMNLWEVCFPSFSFLLSVLFICGRMSSNKQINKFI